VVKCLKSCGQVVSGQVGVYHANRLGSVRWVTDGSQNLVASYVYEGFGKIVGQDGSEIVPYRFCGLWGYRDDGDVGLLHVGARYYEVETGRWVQKDPILGNIFLPQTLHSFVYCINQPINLIDPEGKIPKILIVAALLALIGGAGYIADRGGYEWGDEVSEIAEGIGAVIGGVEAIVTSPGFGALVGGKLIGIGVVMVVDAIVDLVTGEWKND
jgi:hypothetical protein